MMIRPKPKQKQKRTPKLAVTTTQKKFRGRKRRKYKLSSIESPLCSKILMNKSATRRRKMLKPTSLKMDSRVIKLLRQIISKNQTPLPVLKRK